jgi:ribosomal protein L6P/L9E
MSQLLLRRSYSFIGRRPLYFEPSVVQISFQPNTALRINDRVHKTKIIADAIVKGPLGSLKFPIHQGLAARFEDGKQNGEACLRFSRDDEYFEAASKNQRKFINSMWGTTTAHIANIISGVTEVHQSVICYFYC